MTQTTIRTRVAVSGLSFGARGCSSCSCDPCDCNPCSCGDDLLPSIPAWRVSGCAITRGFIDGIDVSGRVILSLALPQHDGSPDEWQEVILVDAPTTSSQVDVLLKLFQAELESIPAEVQNFVRRPRAIYKVPLRFYQDLQGLSLHVTFVQSQAVLIRGNADQARTFASWSYDGPMALRQVIELNQG